MADADDLLAPETADVGVSQASPPPVFRDEDDGGDDRCGDAVWQRCRCGMHGVPFWLFGCRPGLS